MNPCALIVNNIKKANLTVFINFEKLTKEKNEDYRYGNWYSHIQTPLSLSSKGEIQKAYNKYTKQNYNRDKKCHHCETFKWLYLFKIFQAVLLFRIKILPQVSSLKLTRPNAELNMVNPKISAVKNSMVKTWL